MLDLVIYTDQNLGWYLQLEEARELEAVAEAEAAGFVKVEDITIRERIIVRE